MHTLWNTVILTICEFKLPQFLSFYPELFDSVNSTQKFSHCNFLNIENGND
jgi:hypothetical protein